MNPLAHTLIGTTMAEAGLKRKTAMATATLIIGANAPDIDAIAMLVSKDYALFFRRGWTHGILALMIMPFIRSGMMNGINQRLGERRQCPCTARCGYRHQHLLDACCVRSSSSG